MLAQYCILVMFSVPAKWMDWTPWTACSPSCGSGATRQRSRGVIPGKHGANHEPAGNDKEAEDCSTLTIPDWPTCPVPARHGEWDSWSLCTQTCYDEGTFPPMTRRIRKCIEATLSSNPNLNLNIDTCATLPKISETHLCQIPLCPGASYNITSQELLMLSHATL